ncbi:unnamed protein product [Rotaria socialis]|uniref:Uncharacterized protein n=1 Tax=Rotaria socialis TaxID=392032 RepID=A0A820TNM0_9BILA|nr:unnamed protein product [Rotaria socialis]CAF4204101.1 unnamed protein product [Rotaria socialis]CAF4469293.1 unnamed protein product [Rotaria socialis]
MPKTISFGLLLTCIISISADSCSFGKVCGNYPRTFCCPKNTRCGPYATRTCYNEPNGPNITGIIFGAVIGLFIFIMVLKACITCCSSRNEYYPLSSSDPVYLARSGAVVCTVAASRC